jgi:hypothetical protein
MLAALWAGPSKRTYRLTSRRLQRVRDVALSLSPSDWLARQVWDYWIARCGKENRVAKLKSCRARKLSPIQKPAFAAPVRADATLTSRGCG